MAQVIITLKIMPSGVDVDLDGIYRLAKENITEFGGEIGKKEEEPVAFGIKALKLIFIMDESIGSTESLEDEISKIKGVQSVEVTDVRRAIG